MWYWIEYNTHTHTHTAKHYIIYGNAQMFVHNLFGYNKVVRNTYNTLYFRGFNKTDFFKMTICFLS